MMNEHVYNILHVMINCSSCHHTVFPPKWPPLVEHQVRLPAWQAEHQPGTFVVEVDPSEADRIREQARDQPEVFDVWVDDFWMIHVNWCWLMLINDDLKWFELTYVYGCYDVFLKCRLHDVNMCVDNAMFETCWHNFHLWDGKSWVARAVWNVKSEA